MNKVKNYFTIFLLFTIIYLLFRYNYILNVSVLNAVELWLTKVFPSLFIMFIINDIIINTKVLDNIIGLISPIFNKIFNTTKLSCEAFILSLISGTPTSAFIIKELLLNNSISVDDANKLISFTYFSNPLFLYNILNITFNKYITLKIIIIHYISNLIIGLLFRKNTSIDENYLINKSSNSTNIIKLLPLAIKKSINTLLMILGTITFYMIITNLLIKIFNFSNITELLIKGILEITQSLNILPLIKVQSNIKEIIALAIISFGGLSIHTQVLDIINDTKISFKNFLVGRILHVLISIILYIIIFIMI